MQKFSEKFRPTPVIAMIAGEVSGDILGANLIQQLKMLYPNAQFVGIGGERMINAGLESWVDMEEIAVMGLAEVVKHLPRLLKIRRQMMNRLSELRPDIFIGIDAPDFNLNVELHLKSQGIKTLHYVSPSVWAWRQNRIHKIAKATDMVLAFLPFEKAFYDEHHVPCRFIGHSLADHIALKPSRSEACKVLSLAENDDYLTILVGSRHAEVEQLTEPFLRAAMLVQAQYPQVKFLVPLANQKRREQFEQIKQKVAPDLAVITLDGQARQAMIVARATLLASGTASLEAMLCKSPMVVGYKMSGLTYQLAKQLVKTPYISLPNLLAQEMLVPELIQADCTPSNLANALLPFFDPSIAASQQRFALQQRFIDLHRLIQRDADKEAALAVQALLDAHSSTKEQNNGTTA